MLIIKVLDGEGGAFGELLQVLDQSDEMPGWITKLDFMDCKTYLCTYLRSRMAICACSDWHITCADSYPPQ